MSLVGGTGDHQWSAKFVDTFACRSFVHWQHDNKNDVIHIFSDGHIEWFQLNAEGEILVSKIEEHVVKYRLQGTWARMKHVSDLL